MADETEKDSNDRILRIKWRDSHKIVDEYRARNVVFEGSWVIFYDIEKLKVISFPFDLIEKIIST